MESVIPVILAGGSLQSHSVGMWLVVLLALVLIGLAMIYYGFKRYRIGRLVADTTPERIRSVAVGRTEVQGRAEADEATYGKPFTSGRCLFATYSIEEYCDSDDGGTWETIAEGTIGGPFFVADDTGHILVDVRDDPELRLANGTQYTVDANTAPPDPVVEFLEWDAEENAGAAAETGADSPAEAGLVGRLAAQTGAVVDRLVDSSIHPVSSRKRRYTQRVVQAGDELYVFGQAAMRDNPAGHGSNADRLVIRTDSLTDVFIVSDDDPDILVTKYVYEGLAWIVFGALVLSSSFIFLL